MPKPKPPPPPPPPRPPRPPRYTVLSATTIGELEALATELTNIERGMHPVGGLQMAVFVQGNQPPVYTWSQAFYRHIVPGDPAA